MSAESTPSPIEPDPGAPPAEAGAEQFVHGVLSFLNADTPLRREQNLSAAMKRIDAESVGPRRRWLRTVGIAALLALAVGVWRIGNPLESRALAAVRSSAAASRCVSQRFALFMHPFGAPPPREAVGTIDVSEGHLMRMDFRNLGGDELRVGRDASGEWAIRPDGGIERGAPRQAWPRWCLTTDPTLLLASVDDVLRALQADYALEFVTDAPKASAGIHVRGRREGGPDVPQRVDLWIDAQSHLVQRLELRWDERFAQRRPTQDPRGAPRHEAPPELVTIEVMDQPPIPEGWFTPESWIAPGR